MTSTPWVPGGGTPREAAPPPPSPGRRELVAARARSPIRRLRPLGPAAQSGVSNCLPAVALPLFLSRVLGALRQGGAKSLEVPQHGQQRLWQETPPPPKHRTSSASVSALVVPLACSGAPVRVDGGVVAEEAGYLWGVACLCLPDWREGLSPGASLAPPGRWRSGGLGCELAYTRSADLVHAL